MNLAAFSGAGDPGPKPTSWHSRRTPASSGTVLAGVKGSLRQAWQTAARPALDPGCAPCNATWNGAGLSPVAWLSGRNRGALP